MIELLLEKKRFSLDEIRNISLDEINVLFENPKLIVDNSGYKSYRIDHSSIFQMPSTIAFLEFKGNSLEGIGFFWYFEKEKPSIKELVARKKISINSIMQFVQKRPSIFSTFWNKLWIIDDIKIEYHIMERFGYEESIGIGFIQQ